MEKISFIIPSWHYYSDPLKHQPYWELYYATQIKDKGFDVEVVDLRILKENNLTETIKKIPEYKFYFYWIFKTGDANELYSVANLLKKQFPNSIHAAGGTHVDMCFEECQNFFDAVVIGPGENSFQRIIEDSNKKTLLKKYEEKYNSVPFFGTNFPKRSFLPKESIVNKKLFDQYGEIEATLTYFSRGCLYKCGYCTYNVPSQLQVKSPKLIQEEIKYLKEEYNIKGILVKDEVAISPNKKKSFETMNAIAIGNIVWRGQTTTLATFDQLKAAKDSGCLELAIGIETVDDSVMKIINKSWQSEKIIKTFIENANKLNIKIKICLILGLPGEPQNIVEKTIKFLEETKPNYASVSGFLPVPGSPIAKNFKDYGIKSIDYNWHNYSHLLYRFSEDEDVGLPFHYDKYTKWGRSFSKNEIISNINNVQRWLENNSMIY